jgi:hypothetical protein
LSENRFKTSQSSHLLRNLFNNWYGVLQLCFEKKALITLEAREWIIHIYKYETLYDSHFKSDKDFGAKVLGLVDLTFFQFCDSCIRASNPENVDFSLISLHYKRFDILKNCFQANNPASLIAKKPQQPESNDEDVPKEKESKKKQLNIDKDKDPSGGRAELGSLVQNPTPNKD